MTDTAAQPSTPSQGQRLYALFVGLFLAFTLFKVGNPVILDHRFTPPQDAHQWLLFVFPSRWAMAALVPLAVIGLALFGRFRPSAPRWMVWLPLVWFGWQCLSALQTVDRQLTAQTLPHLGACALCFYLGLLVLGQMPRPQWFLWGLAVGLGLLLVVILFFVYSIFLMLIHWKEIRNFHLLAAFPAAIFLASFFSGERIPWWKELLNYILLGSLVYSLYSPAYTL